MTAAVTHRSVLAALLVATALLLLGGCSRGESNADRNRASEPTDDIVITHNVPYASGDRHGLDVYTPRAPAKPRPIVIYFHGGGYDSGSKAEYAWVGVALAREGYVTVVPDFRLYPKVLWPKFLEDCAAAVRWTKDHGGDYGGDPSNLVLMGHSSGAYNAVSLAVDRRWLAEVRMNPGRDLRAVIGLSGPYDDYVPDTNKKLEIIFGRNWPDTQPINHVDGAVPPLMLITGDRDVTVDPPESDRMAAKVRAHGGTVLLVHYPMLDHSGPLFAIQPMDGRPSQVLHDISTFIRAQTAAVQR